MLPEKDLAKNYQQKNKFVTVIHPEKLPSIKQVQKKKLNSEVLVAWLFLIGSFLFLVDGVIELSGGISIRGLLHLSASFLFVVGSALFIPRNK